MGDQGGLNTGEVMQAVSAVREQVSGAVDDARQRLELDRRMQENPWAVLGVAAGAGFLLGGGLWPALKPMVKVVGKLLMTPSNLVAIAAAVGAMRATQGAHGGDGMEPPGAVG